MTQQHEKAFFYDEAVRLAEKHGGTVEIPKHGLPDIVIYASGLAALIAEVRKDEREKCAQNARTDRPVNRRIYPDACMICGEIAGHGNLPCPSYMQAMAIGV